MPRSRLKLHFEAQYKKTFVGLLSFKHLDDAEKTLRRLEQLRQHFLAAGDRLGVDSCRRVALLGRKRAESLSRNIRIAPTRRKQKQEIAHWFALWLESPEIFEPWLALRKDSDDYKAILISQKQSADIHGNKRPKGRGSQSDLGL